MQVRGLLFDLCGVLYDDSAWNRWLLRLLQRMGLHTHYDAFFALWTHEYAVAIADEHDYWVALRKFLQSVGLTKAQIGEVEAASFSRWLESRRQMRPFPGVTKTLALLNQLDIPLGIVARADYLQDELSRCVARLGLGERFHCLHCIPGADDPKATFARAWTELGIEPQYGAYVVSHQSSIAAAKAHCGRLFAFNTSPNPLAHHHLGRFEDLLGLVQLAERRLAS